MYIIPDRLLGDITAKKKLKSKKIFSLKENLFQCCNCDKCFERNIDLVLLCEKIHSLYYEILFLLKINTVKSHNFMTNLL